MQKQTLQTERAHSGVERFIAITIISGNRMARMSRVNPDLMGTAGSDQHFDQRRSAAEVLDDTKITECRFPRGIDHNKALATPPLGRQWQIDIDMSVGPVAPQQSQIAFLHTAVSKKRVQLPQCTATFGDHQASGCTTIQTMDEVCLSQRRVEAPKRLDATESDSGSTMHRHASRFVQHENSRILVENALGEPLNSVWWELCRLPTALRDRWYPHPVTSFQTIAGPNPATIDSHLSRSDQPIDVTAGHASQGAQKEVIQPLSLRISVDLSVVSGSPGWSFDH